MPALLAYLVSLVVFIGTGYGALQWLSAPEPVRTVTVAKKTAPKAPKLAVESEASETQAVTIAPDEATPADTAGASIMQQESMKTQASSTARDALAYAAPVTESKPSPSGAPTARVVTADIDPEAGSKSGPQTRLKRELPRALKTRHASRAPQLMTLRTIEFADGHRETRLLPYRGRRQDFAMDRD